MGELSFNLKEEVNELLFKNFNTQTKIAVSPLSDAVFSVSKNLLGKITIILERKTYEKLKKIIDKSLVSYKGEKDYLIVEESEENLITKTNISLKDSTLLVVGGEKLIVKSVNLAKKIKADIYSFLIEPNVEYIFCKRAKAFNLGLPYFIDLELIKNIYIDLDLMSTTEDYTFSVCYIKAVSQVISLIDYKIKCLTTNKEYDFENYSLLKTAINKALTFSKYTNKREVLIYSNILIALIKANSELLIDSAVELFQSTLKTFCVDLKEGERYLISFLKLGSLYHFYFNNDFSSYLLSCNYNKDIEELSKNTKISSNYFIKNLKIPTLKRHKLIQELKNKVSKAFLNETSAILKIQELVRKTYFAISSKNKNYLVKKEQVKKALKFSTYFSDKITLLTIIRDEGLLNL